MSSRQTYRSRSLLVHYLLQANKDEISAFIGVLGLAVSKRKPTAEDPNHTVTSAALAKRIALAIETTGGNAIANVIRDRGVSYLEILNDIYKDLELRSPLKNQEIVRADYSSGRSTSNELVDLVKLVRKLEDGILNEFLSRTYKNLPPAQRKEFDLAIESTIRREGLTSGQRLAGVAGLMAVANMGGFATYTLLSTVLSTATFGALGFGAYTFASSLLHLLIGPAGWIALISYGAAWLGRPDKKKCLALIVMVTMLRYRVDNERKAKRAATKKRGENLFSRRSLHQDTDQDRKLAIEFSTSALQVQLSHWSSLKGKLDRWALGYIFGTCDASLQYLTDCDSTESLALIAVVCCSVFGQETGTVIVQKCIELQGDKRFLEGMAAGGNEVVSILRNKKNTTPSGLADYLQTG